MLKSLKNLISSIRIYCGLFVAWRRVVHFCISGGSDRRILVIPCDPWSVLGSRGDQAMILAVKQHCGDAEIDILTDSHEADDDCFDVGLTPVAEWNEPFDKWMKVKACRYEKVYILGADVTDGVYAWPVAMKLLMFYDCFSRMGIEIHYLGFSWSEMPSPWMHLVFPLLKRQLPLPIRDPVSYERVAKFTRHRPLVQVADVAFKLNPNPTRRTQSWIDWCRNKHEAGQKVVAVNIHQMFNEAETKSEDWVVSLSRCLDEVAQCHGNISYLLVPHDNRPRVSDLEILKRVKQLLPNSTLIDIVMNADEIKALLGACDALIAGRMHISIAALGQCVPVLGLFYQGKFEGLWTLFKLSNHMLLAPKLLLEKPAEAVSVINRFIDNLKTTQEQIKRWLPSVLELSEQNFE